jgi:hypothetical protein
MRALEAITRFVVLIRCEVLLVEMAWSRFWKKSVLSFIEKDILLAIVLSYTDPFIPSEEIFAHRSFVVRSPTEVLFSKVNNTLCVSWRLAHSYFSLS